VDHTHARIGYVQSDEISLLWLGSDDGGSTIFDGRKQKLCSVLAGLATAAFTAAILASERLASYASRLPHFDCRVLQLPSPTEAANMLLWRELDARKNAISMAARARFSHKALHGKSGRDMLAMLTEAGVDFDIYPTAFTRGTFVRRETFERGFTAEELERIPEKHRPDPLAVVTRSEVRTLDVPPFSTIANRDGVALFGETPVILERAA
jgi:tRNA(His) guanylyltransferase